MHVCIMSTKSVHAVFIVSQNVDIVEITRISAFHGYMTWSTCFFVFCFVFDDFTLSPLGVPPAVRWILN